MGDTGPGAGHGRVSRGDRSRSRLGGGWHALLAVVLGLFGTLALAQAPAPLPAPNLPLITSGIVADAVFLPDGSVIIGGRFNQVAGQPRVNLAKIRADGTLDPDWAPTPNSEVSALALDAAGNVYVGGGFTSISGTMRTSIARLASTGTGTVDPAWNPSASSSVSAIEVVGTDVYVGGAFTSIGGLTRQRLARLSTASGAADPTWNPGADGSVAEIAVDIANSAVYVAGLFTQVGGQARNRLAKLSSTGTGAADATWNPNPNSVVDALAVDGSGNVYAGGAFSSIGGAARTALARLSGTGTGAADPAWVANAQLVYALHIDGGRIYVAGFFSAIGGQPRRSLARLSLATAAVEAFDAQLNNQVFAVAASAGGVVFAGGNFDRIGPTDVYRAGAARFDAATGAALPTPDVEQPGSVAQVAALPGGGAIIGGSFSRIGSSLRSRLARIDAGGNLDPVWTADIANILAPFVNRLFVDSAGDVYVTGQFSSVGGQTRFGFAKISASGTPLPWGSGLPSGGVNAFAEANGSIYIGGTFTAVDRQVRNRLARLDRASGALDATWNPGADNFVATLAADASGRIYAGGAFASVGGQARSRLARIAGTGTGAVDPAWNPGANDVVNAIATDPAGRLYVGGRFTQLGGVARNRIGLLQAETGITDPTWNPSANAEVFGLLPAGSAVFVRGFFGAIGGATRSLLAKIDAGGSGQADPFYNPAPNAVVDGLALVGGAVWTGGFFTQIGGQPRSGLAALPPTQGAIATSVSATVTAPANPVVNQLYIVTAQVTAAGGTPTGQVGLEVGGVPQCTVFLVAGQGTCNLRAPATPGALSIALNYPGRDAFQASTDTLVVNVAAGSPTPLATPNLELWRSGQTLAQVRLPDGSTLVGGFFSHVNGVPRRNLARIRADGSVDPDWNPAPDSGVRALALDGAGNVFVAGDFQRIGGLGRAFLAKLATTGSGSVDPAWNPAGNGPVSALVVDGSSLIAAGNFGVIGGASRTRLARLATTGTGQADPAWNPGANGAVNAIAIDTAGGWLIAGGDFTSIGGGSVARLARLALSGTGAVDATWTPAPNGSVLELALDPGGDVFAAGFFNQIGGLARFGVARMPRSGTGAADPAWDAAINGNFVSGLLREGSFLYIGANFSAVGGQLRAGIARVDSATGAVDAWSPQVNGYPDSIIAGAPGEIQIGGQFDRVAAGTDHVAGWARLSATSGALVAHTDVEAAGSVSRLLRVAGGQVVIAGDFGRIGATVRTRLAKLDAGGALDLAWTPEPFSFVYPSVSSLFAAGGNLYASGFFQRIGGQDRSNVARLSLSANGLADTWDPATSGQINAWQPVGNAVYFGGSFTSLFGVARNRLARLDAVTGALDPTWDPNANGSVSALAADAAGNLYAAGAFSAVGGQARNRLAKIASTGAGAVDPAWVGPTLTSTPNALAVDAAGRLYVGGGFGQIGGQTIRGLARLAPSGALDSGWQPLPASSFPFVQALALDGNGLYVGGFFDISGTQTRRDLARVSLNAAGALDAGFNPAPSGSIAAIDNDPVLGLLVGGAFDSMGGTPRVGIAAFAPSPAANVLFADSFEP